MSVAPQPDDPFASTACWVVAQGLAVEHWPPPPGEDLADRFHRRPLLYLVEPGADPPIIRDDLAEWMQLPGDVSELLARSRTLLGRARTAGMLLTYVDDDDVLRVGNRLAVLSPIEARIMRMLLGRVGRVVSREEINQEIWPAKDPTDFGTLNGRVKLLRIHVAKLPMRIHTVQRRGLLLEVAPESTRVSPDVY